MKKLIYIILFLPLIALGQTQKVSIIKTKIDPISLDYTETKDLDKKSSSFGLSLYWQNTKYTSITDLKFMHFYGESSNEDFFQLRKDLVYCYKLMVTPEYKNLKRSKEAELSNPKLTAAKKQRIINKYAMKANALPKNGAAIRFDRSEYSLMLYDFNKKLYVQNTDGVEGSNQIGISNLEVLIELLYTIEKIGDPNLKPIENIDNILIKEEN
jgi:hypothetical protein